jgi:hypothetical protein
MNFLKRFLPYIIVTLITLPLVFVNIHDTHDWGDDFAQYIMQAKNITEGNPHWQTGYIHNDDAPFVGPRAYPPGFPLLLASVYSACGVSISAFTILISVFLVLFCLAAYSFLSRHFSIITSILLVTLIGWHPWILSFKMEVMSDLPFSFFFMLLTVLYIRRDPDSYVQAIMIGLLAAFAVATRSIGITFLLAVAADVIFTAWKFRKSLRIVFRAVIGRQLVLLATGIIALVLISFVLLPTPAGGTNSYEVLMDPGNFAKIFVHNLSYQFQSLQNFFTIIPEERFLPPIVRACAAALFLFGLITRIRQKFSFVEIVFLCYLGILMIYPYADAGLRFMLPLIPFVLYYVIAGFEVIVPFTGLNKRITGAVLAAFLLLQVWMVDSSIIATQDMPLPGPYDAEAQDAFSKVQALTPSDAVVVFIKPRALALFADRKSLTNAEGQEMSAMLARFKEHNASYYLVSEEISDASLKDLVKDSTKAEQVWSNSKYALYKAIR